MVEFLLTLSALLFGKAKDIKLPNCTKILLELKSGEQIDSQNAERYVWLCRLTTMASAVGWSARALFVVSVFTVVSHMSWAWPFVHFEPEDQHQLFFWAASINPHASVAPFLCRWVAIMTLTFLVAASSSFTWLAKLSHALEGKCCLAHQPESMQLQKPAG